MLESVVRAIQTLKELDEHCTAGAHAEALTLIARLQRDHLPAIEQAIKELAVPTLDYEGWVREVVTRSERGGHGASLGYAFRRFDDDRYDHQKTLDTIYRLVDAGEFVLKNQTAYTPEGWERVKATRKAARNTPRRRW